MWKELLKVVRSNNVYTLLVITKFYTKAIPYHLCIGFDNTYNYVLERSSEYTLGVSQSSAKEDELCVYKLFFSYIYATPAKEVE